MRSRDALAGAALVIASLAACASAGCGPRSTAPPGTLPAIRQVAADPFGAWVTVMWRATGRRATSGELISLTSDLALVLSDTSWTEIPTRSIQEVVVEPHRGEIQSITPYSRLSRSVNPSDLKKIARYARFPGGMPVDIDRASLRSRTVAAPDSNR